MPRHLPTVLRDVYRAEDLRYIVAASKDATDVVTSHFHGDHVPLPDANPTLSRWPLARRLDNPAPQP